MAHEGVGRRELLRLVGAGILAGTVGAGTASAREEAYIVGTATSAATKAVRGQATAVEHVFDFGPFGAAVAGRFPAAALSGLARRPDVRYVEADGQYHAIALDATDIEVSRAWGVDRVDAEKAWATGDGAGAHIAVIDTGIDSDHSDLAGNLAPATGNNHRAWVSAFGYAQPWDDDNGHGTHCAGIAAADHGDGGVAGVARGATLHALKVLNSAGSGYFSHVAAAIEHAADQGWDVASLSLGGTYDSQAVRDAVDYADSRGVLVVAAAGNSGPGTADGHYPSALPKVVAVASTTSTDSRSSFSATGSVVELAAPGSSIRSTYKGGGWATMSGTSMACPHVAGAAALVMAMGKSASETRAVLTAAAEDIGLSSDEGGAGLLDAEAAALAAAGGGGSPPDTTAPEAPTGLASTGADTGSVGLAWDASGAGDLDHYTVYVDGAPDHTTGATSSTVGGLDPDTAYDFHVTASDTAGNESGASNVVSESTDPLPSGGATDPTATIARFEEVSTGSPHAEFEVAWSAADSDGNLSSVTVRLEAGGSVVDSVTYAGTAGATTLLKDHKADGKGRTYIARVTATDSGGGTGEATATATEEGQRIGKGGKKR